MGQIIWQQDPSGLAVSTCIGPRHFPTGTSPPKLSRTLGREITEVDAPDDAVRDAMATPARSATPWRGSLDSLRDLSATCSRKWLLS